MQWRCRRGTKELDVILAGFVQGELATLSEVDRALFDRLLQESDPTLQAWLQHGVTPGDRGMAKMVKYILSAGPDRKPEK